MFAYFLALCHVVVWPNGLLTSERRKHDYNDNETRWPKEQAVITPEQSESGAADVRRQPEHRRPPPNV
jgi:hypothetical protein